jgi:hypothetical protein
MLRWLRDVTIRGLRVTKRQVDPAWSLAYRRLLAVEYRIKRLENEVADGYADKP